MYPSGTTPSQDDLSGSLYGKQYGINVPTDQVGKSVPPDETVSVAAPDAGPISTPANLSNGSQTVNVPAPKGPNTVLAGSASGSGTVDCGSGPRSWSGSGTLNMTISPPLSTLVSSGGSFSGTWYLQFSGGGCDQIIFQHRSGNVSGSMSNGVINITFSTSDAVCSFSGSGTADSLSGSADAGCVGLSLQGSIEFSATNRGSVGSGFSVQ
jgi:hypothetical protein